MKDPILSREEVEALAHRICSRYIHSEDIYLRQYTFRLLTLEQLAGAFEAAVLERVCGEPVVWQWRRGDEPWSLERTFYTEVFATTDDSEVRPLYAINRSKA
ncbi:hypothetical protein [Burkholderia cenocepacia]|jgi:hypothetical protein|uniref:Hypothetical phage protein n=1 Tax=Burkholderia cenocepacia (strain ATCC BAA-245 / DSM 16553 / LMG 16656 / NCTC 13227 / J2315 / CF5610) TaxID=216591 RepID=B4EFN7_BURCJ|nr:hypothetical protein [Burkholderia cenocepacia]KIS51821.1 hypothetical protein NP88_2283 [Burkholderia cepacia]EPZ89258.1 hypothetical protein BURCENK562V_C3064 [Burkholderia cenocepacia K56-2Valvano]ERI31463.1 hypothetical protein BURCENBC7_AP3264 [Burkholderia cenocepacia BC7]KKI81621.1 hypothetical protein WQ49_16320 [Burkholderia cenocepacia]ONR50469.1 hypothetical protein A8E17_33295 [Burkholderia cenocepacia]